MHPKDFFARHLGVKITGPYCVRYEQLTSSLKCLTHAHSGESVLLYILGKNTVFFQLEKEQTFLPSLYTLWKYPEVRPSQDFEHREIVRKEGYTQSQCCGSGSTFSLVGWIRMAVFRIHDILVWIRIWIRVSMPLTNGSGCGSGSFYFHH
jgi:hypothetical protein